MKKLKIILLEVGIFLAGMITAGNLVFIIGYNIEYHASWVKVAFCCSLAIFFGIINHQD